MVSPFAPSAITWKHKVDKKKNITWWSPLSTIHIKVKLSTELLLTNIKKPWIIVLFCCKACGKQLECERSKGETWDIVKCFSLLLRTLFLNFIKIIFQWNWDSIRKKNQHFWQLQGGTRWSSGKHGKLWIKRDKFYRWLKQILCCAYKKTN